MKKEFQKEHLSPEDAELMQRLYPVLIKVVGQLHRSRVMLLAGTDAGAGSNQGRRMSLVDQRTDRRSCQSAREVTGTQAVYDLETSSELGSRQEVKHRRFNRKGGKFSID